MPSSFILIELSYDLFLARQNSDSKSLEIEWNSQYMQKLWHEIAFEAGILQKGERETKEN